MKTYSAFVLDDNVGNKDYLKVLITKYNPEIEVVGEAENIKAAELFIKRHMPQMLFLDIELPEGTSLDLVESWLKESGRIPFQIVFITGHGSEERAIRAFRATAIDYLRKPIKRVELMAAIEKMKEKINDYQDPRAQLEEMLQRIVNPNKTPKTLFISSLNKVTRGIRYDDILYLEADKTITYFILKDERRIVANTNIGNFKEITKTHPNFLQISQSIIVNMDEFGSYKGRDNLLVINGIEKTLSPSKGYQKQLRDYLKNQRSGFWSRFF